MGGGVSGFALGSGKGRWGSSPAGMRNISREVFKRSGTAVYSHGKQPIRFNCKSKRWSFNLTLAARPLSPARARLPCERGFSLRGRVGRKERLFQCGTRACGGQARWSEMGLGSFGTVSRRGEKLWRLRANLAEARFAAADDTELGGSGEPVRRSDRPDPRGSCAGRGRESAQLVRGMTSKAQNDPEDGGWDSQGAENRGLICRELAVDAFAGTDARVGELKREHVRLGRVALASMRHRRARR